MKEQDAVALIGLGAALVLFAFNAARDVPKLFRRRLAPSLAHAVHIALRDTTHVSSRTRKARLAAWTVFTQFVPIVFALSNAPAAVRIASVAEIVAALGWVAYLLRSPRATFPDADR